MNNVALKITFHACYHLPERRMYLSYVMAD